MSVSAFLFGLTSFVAAVASFLIFTSAKSAIHEILGVALGLVSAIFGVGSVATYHLDQLPSRIARAIVAEQSRRTAEAHLDPDTPTTSELLASPRDPSLGWSMAMIIAVVTIVGAVLLVWLNQTR